MRNSLFCIVLLFISTVLYAQSFIPSAEGYRLEADRVHGAVDGYYTAEGNVRLTFKNSEVRADRATYYPEIQILEAEGNVSVKDDIQELKADRIIYNLSDETGVVDNASGIVNGEYFVCAKSVHRLGKQYFMMEDARITTCDSPVPAWSFSFRKLKAEVDGYLIGDHATMNIKDLPLIYTPKMLYPLKINRQTGFLIPHIGYSSSHGAYVGEEFFWAVDYDKDVTLGANYFADRGLQGLIEGRWAITPNSDIYLAADALDDSKSTAGVSSRWRYTSKSVVELPANFEFLADADIVSDYMYIRDFGSYSMYNNPHLNKENVFYEQYHIMWSSKYLDAKLYYRNEFKFTDISSGYHESTIEHEPGLYLNKYNVETSFFNMDYSLAADRVKHSDYMFYFAGGSTNDKREYERLHSNVNIYRSFSNRLFSLTPSIGMNYTRWRDFNFDVTAENDRNSSFSYLSKTSDGYERLLPEFSIKLAMQEIYKYYGESKHGILNTLEYTHVDDIDQTGLPDYLSDDVIDRKNELKWTFRTYYTNESFRGEIAVKQGLDFNESSNILTPLDLKVILSINDSFYNSFEMKYNHYKDAAVANTRDSSQVYYLSNYTRFNYNKFTAYVNYTFDNTLLNDYNTSLRVGGSVEIAKVDLSSWILWQADNDYITLYRLAPIESGASVIWNDQCWSLGLAFKSTRYTEVTGTGRELTRDYVLELIVGFKGLGQSSMRAYRKEDIY